MGNAARIVRDDLSILSVVFSRLKPFGFVAEHIFGNSFRKKISQTYTAWKTDTAVKEGEQGEEQQEPTQVDPLAEKSEDRIRELEIMIREMKIRTKDMEDVLKEHYLDMKLFEDKDDKGIPWYKKIVQGRRTLFDHDVFRGRRQKYTTTQEDSPV